MCQLNRGYIMGISLLNVSYEYLGQVHTPIDGILIIVEKPDALKPLLKILSNSANSQRSPIAMYIISVGLKLWDLPRSDSLKIIVMQEAT